MSDEVRMPQFHPFPSFQDVQTPDMAGEQSKEVPVTPSATNANPLLVFITNPQPGTTTEQLPNILRPFPFARTDQLQNVTPALRVTSTTGRSVRIPGSRKRQPATPTTEDLPHIRSVMSPRLRHGIVLISVFLVVITTLLYLTPLDNGQGGFTFFKGFSAWVQAQQANWQFGSHFVQVAQNNPTQNNLQPVVPPPVTLPTSAYVAIAQQDAINAGISPDYFARQINQESGFNPNAYSPGGAEGIAQFEPGTAAGLGINPWDPVASLNAAAHLMANYNKNYGGNYAMALAAYNGGSGTVQYAINACGASNWMNCLPGETRAYIHTIMGI
ncbi:MAG TPA: lytic transglycosylase domain-containing protein [Ktedonobacteraceae bacterium]|nr:lytic transglycosylase domain-containing protein [Ktedonobacteraceae bacterium]